MKAVLVMVLLAGSLPAAASVAPVRFDPRAASNRQILASFNYASVEAVLDEIGARHRRAGSPPARPALMVVFANGRKAMVTLGSCSADGRACTALSIQAYWTPIAHSPPERTARAIEAFNQRYSFAKAFVAADGRPALERYLTADYGFVRGNLAVNFIAFATQAEQFAKTVLAPLEVPAK